MQSGSTPPGRPIDLERAKRMTKSFRDSNPADAKRAEFYSIDELNTLLAGADGLRIYFGLENNEPKLILVGVQNGKDRVPPAPGGPGAAVTNQRILSDGQPCPTQCDEDSPLSR